MTDLARTLLAHRGRAPDRVLLDCLELADGGLGPSSTVTSAELSALWSCTPNSACRRMKALQRHQLLDATWRTGPGAQYVIKRLGPVACSAIPAHIRRCPGDGSFEDGEWHWREGCDDCLRRAATGHLGWITPPPIIVFECERRIGPGDLPSASPS